MNSTYIESSSLSLISNGKKSKLNHQRALFQSPPKGITVPYRPLKPLAIGTIGGAGQAAAAAAAAAGAAGQTNGGLPGGLNTNPAVAAAFLPGAAGQQQAAAAAAAAASAANLNPALVSVSQQVV